MLCKRQFPLERFCSFYPCDRSIAVVKSNGGGLADRKQLQVNPTTKLSRAIQDDNGTTVTETT